MEHSAKDIMDMARKTLGESIEPEAAPKEFTGFQRPLADIPDELPDMVPLSQVSDSGMEPLGTFNAEGSIEYIQAEVTVEEDGTVINTATGEVLVEASEQEFLEVIAEPESLQSVSEVAIYEPHQQHSVTQYNPDRGIVVEDVKLRPRVEATVYNKFADYPAQLREEVQGIDLYEVKKLNLAAMIETLEQATQSYSSFPSADAALAIASVSTQVHKLTQELEKANDPKKTAEMLEHEVLNKFALDMLQAVSTELKYFMEQSQHLIASEKQAAFSNLMTEITSKRLGPAMQETLVTNVTRLQKALGIKEKL